VREGRAPSEALQRPAPGDAAGRRALREGLHGPLDPELAGGHEVDQRAGFAGHGPTTRDGLRSGHGEERGHRNPRESSSNTTRHPGLPSSPADGPVTTTLAAFGPGG